MTYSHTKEDNLSQRKNTKQRNQNLTSKLEHVSRRVLHDLVDASVSLVRLDEGPEINSKCRVNYGSPCVIFDIRDLLVNKFDTDRFQIGPVVGVQNCLGFFQDNFEVFDVVVDPTLTREWTEAMSKFDLLWWNRFDSSFEPWKVIFLGNNLTCLIIIHFFHKTAFAVFKVDRFKIALCVLVLVIACL